jgi:hypothetical protein
MPGKLCVSVCGGLIGLLATITAHATDSSAKNPIITALRRGDCEKVVKALNAAIGTPDDAAYALFLGGRLLDEGICVKKDPVKAADYFAHSATLGNLTAQLDHAAKIGLGEGAPADYVSAGFECHKGGMDPAGMVSFYSLGYACTVRAVAGRLLRLSLPPGAFQLPTRPAVVEFNPVTSELHITSAPRALAGSVAAGLSITEAAFDTNQAIQKAWRDALTQVPKPDDKSLTPDLVPLSIDMDRTVESAIDSAVTFREAHTMLPSDFGRGPMSPGGMMGMH